MGNNKRNTKVMADGIHGLTAEPALMTQLGDNLDTFVAWIETYKDATYAYTGIISNGKFSQTSCTMIGEGVEVSLPSGKAIDDEIDFSHAYRLPR